MPPATSITAFQHRLSKDVLDSIGSKGFMLAGSSAIREHGIISRLTDDVDIFGRLEAQDKFNSSIDELIQDLKNLDYEVNVTRSADHFCTLSVVKDNLTCKVDIGIDYIEHDADILDIGPVLDVRDAVANKVDAAFSRWEVRDFLDLDAIRESG